MQGFSHRQISPDFRQIAEKLATLGRVCRVRRLDLTTERTDAPCRLKEVQHDWWHVRRSGPVLLFCKRILRPAPAIPVLHRLSAQPVVLLPVHLFSPQLLARPGTALAGGSRNAVYEAARLPGVSALPRTELALRTLAADALL